MLSELRPFQIILLGVFLAFAIGGIALFAIFRGFGSEPNPYGARVEIWGTLDARAFNTTIRQVTESDRDFQVVSYVQKDPRTFRTELVNAVAEGRGPDVVVLPSDLVVSEAAKLYAIPYDTLPRRTIRDTYVDGAEIFSLARGTYGFPFAVDPLVMYWNRSLLSTAGIATPPATWEMLSAQTVPALVQLDPGSSFSIAQAALAFGEYANVTNASRIMLMLLSQAGSALIVEDERGFRAAFNDFTSSRYSTARLPTEAALDFYTRFSNPSRTAYTWSRAMPNDRAAFLSENLALYFGMGSEYASLRAGNPNLNFDAAPVPQGSGAAINSSHGTFYAFAVLNSSPNMAGAYRAAATLGSSSVARSIVEQLGMAPVHRNTIATGHQDPARQAVYTAALIARGFLDPDPTTSESIIRTMIEDVTSGRATVNEAANDAVGRFNQLVR